MVRFECLKCGNTEQVEERYVGHRGTCRKCGNVAIVTAAPASGPVHSPMAEHTVWKGRPSLLGYAGAFLLSLVLVVVFGLGVLLLLICMLHWWLQHYEITNKRVIARTGLLRRTHNEIAISDLRAIETTRTFTQIVMGLGTLNFGSAGAVGYEVQFFWVRRPQRLKDLVNAQKYG